MVRQHHGLHSEYILQSRKTVKRSNSSLFHVELDREKVVSGSVQCLIQASMRLSELELTWYAVLQEPVFLLVQLGQALQAFQ